jgi:spermidine/putrescine transport system substrate-binding protein
MSTQHALVIVALLVLILAGCTDSDRKPALNFINWGLYHDPNAIKLFEREFNVKVNTTLYETNEDLLAKLRFGGSGQFDVMIVANFNIPALVATAALAPLDVTRLPHIKDLDPKLLRSKADPLNKYTLPYLWGSIGIVYDQRKVQITRCSWDVIFKPEAARGPFILLDSNREMMAAALTYLGYDINSIVVAQVGAAVEVLKSAKQRAVGFDSNPAIRVANGQAAIGVAYSGNVRTSGAKHLGYCIPAEGSMLGVDNYAITAKTPQKNLAHAFVDFMLRPDISALNSQAAQHATANVPAIKQLPLEMQNDPVVFPTIPERALLAEVRDVGPAARLYDAAWTRVKGN